MHRSQAYYHLDHCVVYKRNTCHMTHVSDPSKIAINLTRGGDLTHWSITIQLIHYTMRRQYSTCVGVSTDRRIFTCVSYAEARLSYMMDVCPTVCPSVCLSHAGIVSKRLNILSCFLHHAHDSHSFEFCVSQDLREIPTGSPPAGPLNRGGVWKCRKFSTNNLLYLRKGWR